MVPEVFLTPFQASPSMSTASVFVFRGLIDPQARRSHWSTDHCLSQVSSADCPRPGGSTGRPHPFHETTVVCLEGFIQEGFVLGHIPAKPNKGALMLSRLTEPFPGMTILEMESVSFSFHHPVTSPFSFCVHSCRALWILPQRMQNFVCFLGGCFVGVCFRAS